MRHAPSLGRVGLMIIMLVTAAPQSRASPLDAFGFGGRIPGLAGAGTAIADDFSANYYNPAGLASKPGLRLDLGYGFMQPNLRMNGADVGVDPHRGLQGGVLLCGPLLGHRFAASVGIFLPDGLVSRVRALPEAQPRFVMYDNRFQRLVITTSLSVEIVPNLFFGAGLTFLANTKGVVDIEGDVAFLRAENTRLFSAIDVDLQAMRTPTVGLAFRPGKHWRFGVTWREEFQLLMDMTVNVHGDIINDANEDEREVVVADASFVMNALNTNLFSPRQIALGVAYEGSEWLLALDVTWSQWSRFPAPAATVDFELDLGGLPFQLPPQPQPQMPGFEDIVDLRLGSELVVTEGLWGALRLRAGIGFEPSPVPAQTGITNYVDTDKHHFSLGFGLSLRDLAPLMSKGIDLDGAFQVIWLPTQTFTKDDPADSVGNYAAGGLLFGGSLTASLLF